MNNFIEKDIVSAILNKEGFIAKVIDSGITGDAFDKKIFRWVVDSSIEHYLKYSETPTVKILKNKLEKDKSIESSELKKYLRSINIIKKRSPKNLDYSFDELGKFYRKKKLINYLEDTASKIEENSDIDEVSDYLNRELIKLNSSKEKEWEYVDWMDGFEERQSDRKYKRNNPKEYKTFKFGIKDIDEKISRGSLPGDLISIAAKTGRGKSIFTIQVGLQGIFQGFNVTHITTENQLEQTTGRYDSRATGIPYQQIQSYDFNEDKFKIKQANKTINMLRNSIDSRLKIVKCIPNKTTIITIIDILDNLEKKEGHKTDLLIVDSPELMNPTINFKDYRIQKAAVYWEIKSLLLEKNIIGFVTSQLNRGSDDSMPTAEDMSEAYDKARLLDTMLVLIRTTKHLLTDQALLWITKSRDFENDGIPIVLNTDFSCMFIDV